MKLYWKLFVRVIFVNTLLSTVVWAIFSFVMVRNHREDMLRHFRTELVAHRGVINRFLLWDDILSVQSVLENIVEENSIIDAAFVLDGERSVAYTFRDGIPSQLKTLQPEGTEHPIAKEFISTDGNILYDIAALVNSEDVMLHLIISRSSLDKESRPILIVIVLIGVLMTIAGIPVAILFASWTTKEVERLTFSLEKRTKELEHLNRELESFSYSVSHDLRAPLRAIDGFSRILLEDNMDELSDKAKDSLSRIMKAVENMGNLIDSILKLSRIGRRELERKRVNLSEIVSNITENIETGDNDRKVDFKIAENVFAEVDKHLISVALENLLRNAVKFSSKGERAEVEFKAEKSGDMTVYSIKDNGVGFNMKYCDKLFKPFQKLHGEREFSGTGIGLSIVDKVISMHGGRIWAKSEPGKGAEFFFTLNKERRFS